MGKEPVTWKTWLAIAALVVVVVAELTAIAFYRQGRPVLYPVAVASMASSIVLLLLLVARRDRPGGRE